MQRAIGVFLSQVVVKPTSDRRHRACARPRCSGALRSVHVRHWPTPRTRRQAQPGTSEEDLAQNYRIDFEPPADRFQLRVGPLRPAEPLVIIDLVTAAPGAAHQLVAAIGAALVQDQLRTAGK
jgi:hypothetical protein